MRDPLVFKSKEKHTASPLACELASWAGREALGSPNSPPCKAGYAEGQANPEDIL